MSSFDERQKSFEKKFAHDQELQFKVSARRNKYIGQWASKILGYDEEKEKEYIQSVIKADFAEAGDEDVFRKVKEDLKNHNIPDEDIRKKMNELNEKAKSDFISNPNFFPIFLELMHIIVPNRSFEVADLLGNVLGVILALILYKLFTFRRSK